MGDVDIVVDIQSKIDDEDDREKQEQAKIKEEYAKGRSFNNMPDELFWPRTEVMRFLKARSGYLSRHPPEDQILKVVPSQRVIFEEP